MSHHPIEEEHRKITRKHPAKYDLIHPESGISQPKKGWIFPYTITHYTSMGRTVYLPTWSSHKDLQHARIRVPFVPWDPIGNDGSTLNLKQRCNQMGVSKHMGTPKWMVKIMENPIKMDDLGGNPTIFGNPQMVGGEPLAVYCLRNLDFFRGLCLKPTRWVHQEHFVQNPQNPRNSHGTHHREGQLGRWISKLQGWWDALVPWKVHGRLLTF